jgi:HlyD family secretion protein
MRRLVFAASILGAIAAIVVACLAALTPAPLAPAVAPHANPYSDGIFANGIVESDQQSGGNVNLYPEVAGTVLRIPVAEGDEVKKGDLLLQLDDSVQAAQVEQLHAQVQAAETLLAELEAEPRPETLAVAEAQVAAAETALKTAQDQLDKLQAAHDLNPKAVSRDALDSASNATLTARANLEVARRQRDLTKAGAWCYDIANQAQQRDAIRKSWLAASAQLAKYRLVAPQDGVVLAVAPPVGGFVSAAGSYDAYTQSLHPVIVLGSCGGRLNVRCYVDEILVPRLPPPDRIKGVLAVRGSDVRLPIEYVRTQPLVSPKIELSDQRLERVDLRVLPVIFRFERPQGLRLYPGQLVDVYIGE